MSAFIVDQRHIDALVCAGLGASRYGDLSWRHDGETRYLRRTNANEVGALLWAENVASVEHRYSPAGREAIYGEGWDTPEQSLPGAYRLELVVEGVEPVSVPQWWSEYLYPLSTRPLKPVEVLKAIDCYEYQSCEHDGWEASEAFAFCASLRRAMVGALPGYDEADWSIS